MKLTDAGIETPIRQLKVDGIFVEEQSSGSASYPDSPGAAIAFPAYFTLRLGAHHGTLDLTITALDDQGAVVANGIASYAIAPGKRGSITIALAAGAPPSSDAGAADGGPESDLAPPDLALPPDLLATDAQPDLNGADLAQIAQWRYAAFSDHSKIAASDLWLDQMKLIPNAMPGYVAPHYQPISSAPHAFDVHPAGSDMTVIGTLNFTPPLGQLTTVFSAQNDCMTANPIIVSAYSIPNTPSDRTMADLYIVHAACQPASINFAVAAMPLVNLNFGKKFMVTVAEGVKTISAYDGNTLLATIDVKVGQGEVWTVFYYYDNPGGGVDMSVGDLAAVGGDMGGDMSVSDLSVHDLGSSGDLASGDGGGSNGDMTQINVPSPAGHFVAVRDLP